MSRRFILECTIDLPDDGFEQAETIAKIKAPWEAMVEAITAIAGQHRAEITETRPKTPAYVGLKRGRKPKRYPVAISTPDEAAD